MMKKIFFVLCVAIFTGGCIRADAASVTLKPFPKETYPIEDTILTGVEPNVLFLLDVGSAMTFTPQGTMPLFDSSPDVYASILNIWPEMASATYRAGLLAQSTYGTGTRPFSIGGGNSGGYGHVTVNTGTEQSLDGYSRFGRDLIPSDNIIGDTNSYYTPDPAKPYLLTFRDKDLAESPTLPPGFSAGVAATNPEQLAQLVPNDSRMYQMKLVLWRLLSEENQQLLSRMRVGMATSYQEINYPKTYQFDFYRNAPYLSPKTAETFNNYGSYTQTYKYFLPDGLTQFSDATSHDFLAYDHGSWRTTPFPHGTAPDWASGIKENFSSATQIQGAPNYIYRRVLQYNASGNGDYGGAQTAYGGVIRDFYSFPMGSNEWRQVNRAVFKIPFDYLYKLQGDGSYIGTNNLLRFRSYIDGIEQGDGDMSDYQDPYVGNPNYNRPEFMWNKGRLTNPELFADGKTPLATSIYGRNFHVAGGNTLKAMQDKNVILLGPQNGNDGTRERVKYQYGYLDFERYKNSEGLMAGGGVGSAIDFFSPREKDLTWNTGTGNDTRGFFPITGSCQANWLVVFTAGNDDVPGYPPEEAVKNLYENSKEMRGRSWDGSKWVEVKKMTWIRAFVP